jgi:hypothetical protein
MGFGAKNREYDMKVMVMNVFISAVYGRGERRTGLSRPAVNNANFARKKSEKCNVSILLILKQACILQVLLKYD